MIDVDKQVAYWHSGSLEDWEVAQELIDLGRVRHALFLAHLALEKMLKALVCRQTKSTPPRIHNLTRLVELSGLQPSEQHSKVLAEMNRFSVEGRYTPALTAPPSLAKARDYLSQTEDVLQWLIKQL